MANKFATNFPPTATNSTFNCMWKLTRVMKAAGWSVLASSNGAQIDASGTQANDLWGGAADPTTDSYSSVSTTWNSGSVSLPQATITVASTTGFPSTGTISVPTTAGGWQNVAYTGTTSTTFTGCTGGTGAVVNGYEVVSGATTIGLDQVAAWIVLSGPTTIKVPLNVIPTGTFVRNETVSQATSLATGQLMGYVWDTIGLTGWAVISPMTGTFDQTHVITGSTSGATMSPVSVQTTTSGAAQTSSNISSSGTFTVGSTSGFAGAGSITVQTSLGWQNVAYTSTSGTTFLGCTGGTGTPTSGGVVAAGASAQTTLVATLTREFAIYKTTANVNGGSVYYICGDKIGEITQLFSTLAGYTGYGGAGKATGVTAIVGPGNGGTNNSLNTVSPKAICCLGTAGATTAASFVGAVANFQNNAQIGCANAVIGASTPADGSFYLVCSSTVPLNSAFGLGFTIMDDTEPGDCDPYAYIGPCGIAYGSWTNASTTSNSNGGQIQLINFLSSGNACMFGYQSRANTVTTRDTIVPFDASILTSPVGNNYVVAVGGLTGAIRLVNTPATVRPFIRESFTLYTFTVAGVLNSVPQVKGRARWWTTQPIGNTYDTFDTKTWLVLSIASAGTPAICVGPYDGSTVPIQ